MTRIFTLMCAALLVGCAPWTSLTFPGSGKEDAKLDAAGSVSLRQLLDHEPANTLITLADSPWGSNVQVLLHEPYAAASGRNCRRLTIEPEGQSYPALVCQHPQKNQDWAPVRLLQIGGRPVLSQSPSLPAWNER